MKMNHHIVNTTYPSGYFKYLRSHGPDTLSHHIGRAPLTAATLVVAVALATGCSSTDAGLNARLISPIPTDPQALNSEADNLYQPPRSPAFDPGLFGG
jgi:hypothetical protein